YATSSDGVNWSPSSGSSNYLLNMNGYPNWANADVNGGNVTYKHSAGIWHLFFIDFTNFNGVFHATSSDAVNYTYQDQVLNNALVPQDLKAFVYNGVTY